MSSQSRRGLKLRLQKFIEGMPWITRLPLIGGVFADVRDFDRDPKARQRIFDRERELLITLRFYAYAPAKWAGGLFLNQLGYAAFRSFWFNLKWFLRPAPAAANTKALKAVADLNREGVTAIPSALSSQDLEDLNKEFDRLRPQFNAFTPEYRSLTVGACEAGTLDPPGVDSEVVRRIFRHNPLVEEVVSAAAHRKIRLAPEISFIEYVCRPEDIGKPQSDGQDILHFDVGYPSFKVFYYLEKTTRTTGAFTFAKGTHRFSWKRALLEFRMSVDYYKRLGQGVFYAQALEPADRKLLQIEELAIEGDANTLVFFNTMGFHRRGDFLDREKTYRRVILINYRHLDTWANTLGIRTAT